jgi:hypothetical protein
MRLKSVTLCLPLAVNRILCRTYLWNAFLFCGGLRSQGHHFIVENLPSPISQVLFYISSTSLISHLSSLISHLSSLISHHPSPISHLPSPISHLPSPISHLSSPISHLIFYFTSHISHLSSLISHLTSHISHLTSHPHSHRLSHLLTSHLTSLTSQISHHISSPFPPPTSLTSHPTLLSTHAQEYGITDELIFGTYANGQVEKAPIYKSMPIHHKVRPLD